MSTLLQKFIKNKVAAYTEPTRKRVPKGHKIGFPLRKFHASLLCLANYTGESIATKVGVTHTQFRVWKTQADFKITVKKNAEEFARVFLDYLIAKGKALYELSQQWAKEIFPDKVKDKGRPDLSFEEIEQMTFYQRPSTYIDIIDSSSYQPFLITLIVQKLSTVKLPKEIERYVHALMWYVLRDFARLVSPTLKAGMTPIKQSVERVLDEAIQLALRPNLTDGERQNILILLTTLKLIL